MDASAHPHFRHRRLVEFADTDLAGIMHFANFFKFVEVAEHAFFRSLGESIHSAAGSRHDGWPRIEVACKYHRPARFQETLEVRLRIAELRTTSLSYAFAIHSADAPGEPLLAAGTFGIIHVELDTAAREMRKAPIPAALRAKLEAAMGKTV
jgi:acyl-CoA thioester hydrolase